MSRHAVAAESINIVVCHQCRHTTCDISHIDRGHLLLYLGKAIFRGCDPSEVNSEQRSRGMVQGRTRSAQWRLYTVFVRLYGDQEGGIHPNFSLGISKKSPRTISFRFEAEGIIFYFEAEDQWYLTDHNLNVTLAQNEVVFSYSPA